LKILVDPRTALLAGVIAISSASILIRWSAAPPLAVVAHRLVYASAVMAAASAGGLRSLSSLTRRGRVLLLASGLVLALHFGSWVYSLYLTSVAASTVIVTSSSIFSAVLSWVLLGEPPSLREVAGILTAMAGVVLIAWGHSGGDGLLGDLLALVGAVAMALHMILGRRLRRVLPVGPYMAAVSGVAGLSLLAVSLSLGDPLLYPAREHLIFLALALGPSCLGHTAYNYALKRLRAYAVGAATMGEPLGASILAALLLGEVPSLQTAVGGIIIALGVYAVLGARGAA